MKKAMDSFYKETGSDRIVDNNKTKVVCRTGQLENYYYSICYNEVESNWCKIDIEMSYLKFFNIYS